MTSQTGRNILSPLVNNRGIVNLLFVINQPPMTPNNNKIVEKYLIKVSYPVV
jgi:hypothetical protein